MITSKYKKVKNEQKKRMLKMVSLGALVIGAVSLTLFFV